MEGGDLSNLLPPRWLIVFEGVIGAHPTKADRARFDFYVATRAWKHAVDTMDLDLHTAKVLWDLTWRRSLKFDVATFLPGRRTREHVEDWIEHRGLPVCNVRQYASPAELGRQLVYLPDVWAVVHADTSCRFTYGDRGMLVTQGWTI